VGTQIMDAIDQNQTIAAKKLRTLEGRYELAHRLLNLLLTRGAMIAREGRGLRIEVSEGDGPAVETLLPLLNMTQPECIVLLESTDHIAEFLDAIERM